jgi:PmbA protein
VFENRAAESLIGLISGYFSAKHVDEKTSPLAGRLGDAVFAECLSLVDDPLLASGVASRPMDDEGYGSDETVLVAKGRLQCFLTNSVYAKKMNLPHTAHASRSPETDLTIRPSNLLIEPGKQSLEDLLRGHDEMILITSLQGTAGFRETSGDFSIPVEGFLYRKGELQSALKDFLISGNILQLLRNVDAVGNDVLPPIGTIICPSLRVHDLNVSGEEIR